MCTNPTRAWFCYDFDPEDGIYLFSLKDAKSFNHFEQAELPCGKCLECTMKDKRGWTARALCEAQMHDCASFITLTYNDECLPPDAGLCRAELKSFIDNLRVSIKRQYGGRKIVVFGCGEYGGNPEDRVKTPVGRPHYHLCIFGFDFPDRQLFKMSHSGFPIYRSPFLESKWRRGHSTVQALEFGDMAYCAGYVEKKTLKRASAEQQQYFSRNKWYYDGNPDGILREAEFRVYPVRPALGADWLDKFFNDAYPSGFIVVQGKKFSVPKYFDKVAKERDPEMFERVKQERREKALRRADENTPEKRAVREELLRLKVEKTRKTL